MRDYLYVCVPVLANVWVHMYVCARTCMCARGGWKSLSGLIWTRSHTCLGEITDSGMQDRQQT